MKNRLIFRSLVVAVVFAAAACSRDSAPRSDTGLSQDLALANQMQQTQPTLQDAPISPKPVEAPPPPPPKRAPDRIPDAPTVRAAPPPPQPPPVVQAPAPRPDPVVTTPSVAPASGAGMAAKEIGSGSALMVTSTGRVCTNANRPGDKVVATLAAPVTGSNGAVIPAGSSVVLEVASVTPGDRPEDARIGFRLRAVVVNNVSYPATGEVTPVGDLERVAIPNAPGDDKKKVIGGAIAGAIAGKILGGSTKGAVIGAAAGAATGAAVAKSGQKYDACLAQGASMRVVLNDRIVIT
jgi:hypothetical protein